MFNTFFNKNNRKNALKTLTIAAVSVALLTITACTKGSLGNEILPSDDLIQVTSDTTFSMTAQTINDSAPLIYNDNVRSDSSFVLRNYLCGAYNDPIFGQSSASLYIQFRPDQKPSVVGMKLPIDSVVLVLPYTYNYDQYGDTTAVQHFTVSRLTEDMNFNTNYRADKDFTVDANPIAEATFIPTNVKRSVYTHKFIKTFKNDKDSLVWYQTTAAYPTKEIRIKLNGNVYPNYLTDTAKYIDNTTFTAYFKGMKIAPDIAMNSAMLRVNLLAAGAGVFVYQHDTITKRAVNNLITDVNRVRDTSIIKTRLMYHDEGRPRTVRFQQAPSALIQNAIAAGAGSHSPVYLQGGGGPLTRLNFTNLKAKLGKAVINKAELFIVTPDEPNTKYKQPFTLLSFRRNAYGHFTEIRDLDQTLTNSSTEYPYYGKRNVERINGQSCAVYNMNIGDHIQDIINGKYDPYLYLSVFGKRDRSERLVIDQNLTARHGFFLRIHYTKL